MSLLSRLLNVVRRDRMNRDLDDELRFHLAARTDELTSRGMPPEDATQQARRQLGNTLLLRESSRDVKLYPRLESILQDVVFGLRLCRKNIVATAAAVVSLGLAIGACTGCLLADRCADPEAAAGEGPGAAGTHIAYRAPGDAEDSYSSNYPLFERLRDAGGSHIQLFGMSDQSKRDGIFDDAGGRPERIYAQWISGDAFALLGVKPSLGRLLTASDDLKPGQHPVAVLSYDFWSRRFGKSPSVVGRWLTIRGKQLQIVGVVAQGFTGVEPGIMTEIWVPNMMWDEEDLSDSGSRWFRIWGRMQPGVPPEQVRPAHRTVY